LRRGRPRLDAREIYRHSPKDAEAYDEYSRRMARTAKAIKPLISLVPPDPTSLSLRDLLGLLKLGRYAAGLRRKRPVRHRQADHAGLGDLLDEWFETDALKGTKAASGIIGTFLGPARRAPPMCCCTTTWARSTGPSAPGGSPRAARAGQRRDRQFGEGAGVEIRVNASVREVIVRPAALWAWLSRTEMSSEQEQCSRPPIPSAPSCSSWTPSTCRGFCSVDREFRVRGSSAKVNIALNALPTSRPRRAKDRCIGARSRSAPASTTSSVPMMTRSTGRSREIRTSTSSSVDDRSGHGASRQHVMSCFVQYAPTTCRAGGTMPGARRWARL